MSESRTLDSLRPGARGTVTAVLGGDGLSARLDDLGFWAGTEVAVVRRALGGDPIQIALRGYHLALRRSEAARIVIAPAHGLEATE